MTDPAETISHVLHRTTARCQVSVISMYTYLTNLLYLGASVGDLALCEADGLPRAAWAVSILNIRSLCRFASACPRLES